MTTGLVLTGHDLSKQYGAVVALASVDVEIRQNRITALVGDNGAGKSTLLKLLAGALQPDSGTIRLGNAKSTPVSLENPRQAQSLGIEAVYQDLGLVPTMTISQNLFLGSELIREGRLANILCRVDRREMRDRSREILKQFGIELPSRDVKVSQLSGGQRQAVAIGRAVQRGRQILLLDEPTASLGVVESEKVLALIRKLRNDGLAVLIISHNLDEVTGTADDAVVLRQGRVVGRVENAEVTRERLVDLLKQDISSERPNVERVRVG